MRTITVMWLTLLLLLCARRSEAEPDESEKEASLAAQPPHSAPASVRNADGDGGPPDEEHITSEPAAESALSKLTIHGYLSQAYATAHYVEIPEDVPEGVVVFSPTALEATLGIPEGGTTNYRNVALQFRYDLTPQDVVTIQLSSEKIGFSPISEMKDEVLIDWAYYERSFKQLKAKVGRIPIPKGIYNEIRDVGTILPFFHPPWSIYLEGVFASEAVDGVALYNTFLPQSDWQLDAAIWGGSYEVFGGDPNNPNSFIKTHSDNVFGLQLWLGTLRPEIQVGVFSSWADIGDAGFFQGLEIHNSILSVDASFSRLAFRSEWMHDSWNFSVPFGPMIMDFHNYYAQVGYLASPKFQLWLQYDALTGAHEGNFFSGGRQSREKLRETRGISFIYQFMTNLVLRAEHHLVRETQAFFSPVFEPGGVMVDRLLVHLDQGDYTIVSLSVSF